MPQEAQRVAVVVAGAGARGGYEAGVLSVLIPRLHDMGVNISMYVGTSAGAINATIFAALSHLSPAEQAQRALDVWRGLKISDVFESPVITSPGIALRFIGQTLRVPGLRLTSLLDTEPLRRKAETAIDWNQLRSNIDNQTLTLAVAATSGDNSRTVVFVDRSPDAGPLPPSDDGRPIDYVHAEIGPEHVLASSAIPIAFPPIQIQGPAGIWTEGFGSTPRLSQRFHWAPMHSSSSRPIPWKNPRQRLSRTRPHPMWTTWWSS